jgi:hypothetical protein
MYDERGQLLRELEDAAFEPSCVAAFSSGAAVHGGILGCQGVGNCSALQLSKGSERTSGPPGADLQTGACDPMPQSLLGSPRQSPPPESKMRPCRRRLPNAEYSKHAPRKPILHPANPKPFRVFARACRVCSRRLRVRWQRRRRGAAAQPEGRVAGSAGAARRRRASCAASPGLPHGRARVRRRDARAAAAGFCNGAQPV